jgi:hypothetical protein
MSMGGGMMIQWTNKGDRKRTLKKGGKEIKGQRNGIVGLMRLI